jgi:hypothetical protein
VSATRQCHTCHSVIVSPIARSNFHAVVKFSDVGNMWQVVNKGKRLLTVAVIVNPRG